MKEYKVHEARKARTDLGNCCACQKEIKKGELYRHTHVSGGIVFFCGTCPVNQALIGKNKIEEPVVPAPITEFVVPNAEAEEPAGKSNAVYCTKCKGTHVINSRRYRQHKNWLNVS